jgi:hypothetical protein
MQTAAQASANIRKFWIPFWSLSDTARRRAKDNPGKRRLASGR